jgi:hypothetical protein
MVECLHRKHEVPRKPQYSPQKNQMVIKDTHRALITFPSGHAISTALRIQDLIRFVFIGFDMREKFSVLMNFHTLE